MGQIIYEYFNKAGKIGGIKARTKLSILTQISSIQAKTIEDSDRNIKLFEEAMNSILLEFQVDTEVNTNVLTTELNKETAKSLRRQMSVIADLLSQRELYIDNLPNTYHRITESISEALDVERAGIWIFNEDKTGITCIDYFVKKTNQHTQGSYFAKKDFPIYFKTVETEKTIVANDVNKDPRINEFSEIYWKPNDIRSSLDVPFWTKDELLGIVCLEHVGSMRTWTSDEENFAYIVGCIIAVVVEKTRNRT